jgi:hypothetical protein
VLPTPRLSSSAGRVVLASAVGMHTQRIPRRQQRPSSGFLSFLGKGRNLSPIPVTNLRTSTFMNSVSTSSTSHGIWFSSRKMSLWMLGPVESVVRFCSTGSSPPPTMYCSRKQPSRNIMAANSASPRPTTAGSSAS